MRVLKTRYDKNQRKPAAGISMKPKGRPRTDGTKLPPSVQQLSKLSQLQYDLASKEVRPAVKHLATYRHKDKSPIIEMCRFFHGSRSGYYDMDTPAKDLPLAEKIKAGQNEGFHTYGY